MPLRLTAEAWLEIFHNLFYLKLMTIFMNFT